MGAHNELTIEGLAELRAALRNLPEELAEEAGAIVAAHAEDAYRQMDEQYAEHENSGALRAGLSLNMEYRYLRFGARAVLKNRAPHAWWAEHGTMVRRTSKGVSRGAMPPLKIFIPIAMRVRRRMVAVLVALVQRAGIVVTGESSDYSAAA